MRNIARALVASLLFVILGFVLSAAFSLLAAIVLFLTLSDPAPVLMGRLGVAIGLLIAAFLSIRYFVWAVCQPP